MKLFATLTTYLLFVFIVISNSFAQKNKGGIPLSMEKKINLPLPYFHTMPAFNAVEMLAEDDSLNANKIGPFRFGKNFNTAFNLENSGTWTNLKQSGLIWRLGISSPGAYSINLIFEDYYLPPGAFLFIYNENKTHILGAFTHLNNHSSRKFATDLIMGDKIILEYYEPEKAKIKGSLLIATVTHAYRDILKFSKSDFGSSGQCNINVNCKLGESWEEQIRSVVMLVSGGNGFCSGVLINNSALDGKPYILTANHCGNSGFESWIFRFNWEAPDCENPTTAPPFQSLTGAKKRANNPVSDFLLLEMFDKVPQSYNAYFSGWENKNNQSEKGVTIHHPKGDIKKISEYIKPTVSENIDGTEIWKVISWNKGTTEPGSSGSPLFDQNHRIIGQLYGGLATCDNPKEDYYGKLSTSWDGISNTLRLRDWLDPINSGVTFLNGYDFGIPAFSLDAGIIATLIPKNESITCVDSITPVLLIKNFGLETINSVVIEFKINNLPAHKQLFTLNLIQGDFDTLILNTIGVTVGDNFFTAFVSNPNESIDQNMANDSIRVNFKIKNMDTIISISPAFRENFEGLDFPPEGWDRINPDNSISWTRTKVASSFSENGASIRITNFHYNTNYQSDYLLSPALNFTGSSPPTLEFDVAYSRFSSLKHDSLIVSVSVDCMLNWERIYAKGNALLSTNNGENVTISFVPKKDEWRKEIINLNQFKDNQSVFLRFENINGNGNNLYLDNIAVYDALNSISNENPNPHFSIFPNPSSSIFIVKSTEQVEEITVYNLLGEVILKLFVKKHEQQPQIDLSAFPDGIYIVELIFLEGKKWGKLSKSN
ncbi:MAG: T9SS type A sorting domain-containing protein [Bacteroidetes bacterium]|nr:T9SS type A sorting domain-containing protein [Bacteroidota bacterium]HET6243390.1 T9SS type A sorting domain-containing protein [Bacteroidia bacterium]